MLCSRCKKRPAMVFITEGKGETTPQGLCLTCAKELGLKPLDDIMGKMGISEEDVDAMAEQMSSFFMVGDDEITDEDWNERRHTWDVLLPSGIPSKL